MERIVLCLAIFLVIFNVTWYVLIMNEFDKNRTRIKEFSDKQFDAEQVLKMYEMKFNRPIYTQERADIQCLYQTVELPYEFVKDVREGRIDERNIIENELVYRFSKMILPYIEIEYDSDFKTMTKIVKGRLRVVKKHGLQDVE